MLICLKVSNPAIILNKVVFPHPDGPNKVVNLPSSITILHGLVTSLLLNDFEIFFKVIFIN